MLRAAGQGPLGRDIVIMTVRMGRPAKISSLSQPCGDLSGTAVMAGVLRTSGRTRSTAASISPFVISCQRRVIISRPRRVALRVAGGFNFAAFGVPLKALPDGHPSKEILAWRGWRPRR
jgi:hypothetical protein